jgi:hypothetical protein
MVTPRPTIPILNQAGICLESLDIPGYSGHGPWFKVDIMGLGVILVPMSPPDPLYRFCPPGIKLSCVFSQPRASKLGSLGYPGISKDSRHIPAWFKIGMVGLGVTMGPGSKSI